MVMPRLRFSKHVTNPTPFSSSSLYFPNIFNVTAMAKSFFYIYIVVFFIILQVSSTSKHVLIVLQVDTVSSICRLH